MRRLPTAQALGFIGRQSAKRHRQGKGEPLTSYVLAFGILGFGLGLAGVMLAVPRVRRRLEVRRFRKQLTHVDFVALAWRESLRDRPVTDELPTSHETRRGRRLRRGEHDTDGDALV